MNKHNISRLSGILASVAVIVGIASCGPATPPTQNTAAAKIAPLSFKGVSVSEIEGNATKNSIVLGWATPPSGSKKVTITKKDDVGQSILREIDLSTEPRQGYSDESVSAGKKYTYILKIQDAEGKVLANGETEAVEVVSAENIPEFSLTSPKQANEPLLDPKGLGVEFSWGDAQTSRYYVQVTDPTLSPVNNANIRWASIVNSTKTVYGAESQAVPFYLNNKFVISKDAKAFPDPKQGQVEFKPLGKGSHTITVMAIKASPAGGDLNFAKSIVIRTIKGTFVGP